ncbi:MAG TPA: hypothetical protein VF606_10115 [Geminicoccaceae bacterium]
MSPAERYLRDLGRRLLQGSDTTGFDLSARRVWFEAKAAELLGPDVLRVLPAPALCVPNATPTSGPRVALL